MNRTKCEVYSRVCGYLRAVTNWNIGKQEEFKDRKTFSLNNKSQVVLDNSRATTTCESNIQLNKLKENTNNEEM